jgi:translation initiation factor 1
VRYADWPLRDFLQGFQLVSKKVPLDPEQKPLLSPFSALDPSSYPAPINTPDEGARKQPVPSARQPKPAKHLRVVLRREKAMRGGKTVIVISQLPTHLSPPELEALLKRAKQSLGCGGSLSGREIEIQGDQAGRVRAFLGQEGFTAVGPG